MRRALNPYSVTRALIQVAVADPVVISLLLLLNSWHLVALAQWTGSNTGLGPRRLVWSLSSALGCHATLRVSTLPLLTEGI